MPETGQMRFQWMLWTITKTKTKGNVKTVDSDVENERKQPNWLAMNRENKRTKSGTDIREEIVNFDLWLFLFCSSQLHYSKEDLSPAPIRKLKNLQPLNIEFVWSRETSPINIENQERKFNKGSKFKLPLTITTHKKTKKKKEVNKKVKGNQKVVLEG